MKLRNLLLYMAILAFAGWCFIAFRADIASISFHTLWVERNAVLLAALLSVFNYLLRTFRWSTYLASFGFRFPAGFTGLSYMAGFAFSLSPGKVGEMVRARYYKDAGVPISSTAAAFFVERLMDVLAMSSLALLGLAASSDYGFVIWLIIGAMVGMLAILASGPWERCQNWLARHEHLPATLRSSLGSVLRTLVSGRTLLRPGLLAFSLMIGLAAWGAEGLGLMVLGGMVPAVQIDPATAIGIYAIAIIVGALSFLPGGLGTTEVVMITLLVAHGYAMPEAILLTMVCRVLTLWLAVVIGWCAVFLLRHYPEPAPEKS